MSTPSLLERLKKARIVQVLIVYLGASWVVLQLVGTLKELLVLPDWIGPVTVILLGIGLVVISATAWVQSLESTTQAEEAGEVPTDWEVAPADVVASLKSGRLPHLTWGRAILGGVVALSLAIGAAGGYVLLTGGQGLIGPTEAGASGVAEGIAVLPFEARGEELAIYREGMVDLLSASFDGIGGYRTIDSRTVLARWSEEVEGLGQPDLSTALRAAGQTGARYAVLGSMVPAGTQVRLQIEIYDVSDGSQVGDATVDGAPEQILTLVDELSIAIARELLGASGAQAATERRLASITTHSVDALKDYLEGERLYRLGDFEAAIEALERAVATDSTFALAWARLGATAGWTSGPGVVRSREARTRSLDFMERLSPREALLSRARALYNDGDIEAIALLEEYTRRYPDDAEAWYDLGDSRYHMTLDMQGLYHASRDGAWAPLRRAAELDPTFSPYQIHLVDFSFVAGDSAAAAAAIDAYRAANGAENQFSAFWDTGFDLLFGDGGAVERALAQAVEIPDALRVFGLIGMQVGVDDVPRELALVRALARARGASTFGQRLTNTLLRAGRWQESRALLVDGEGDLRPLDRAAALLNWQVQFDLGDGALAHELLGSVECEPGSIDCLLRAYLTAQHGALEGHEDETREGLAALPDAADALLASPPFDGNPAAARTLSTMAAQAPAMALLLAGDARAAYEAFMRVESEGPVDHFGMAQAADAVDDHERAERYYLAADWRGGGGFTTHRLARLYEETGRPDDALEQYRRLARMWAEADADFEPWVEVQAALQRLGG